MFIFGAVALKDGAWSVCISEDKFAIASCRSFATLPLALDQKIINSRSQKNEDVEALITLVHE